jgi:hypothetical protein
MWGMRDYRLVVVVAPWTEHSAKFQTIAWHWEPFFPVEFMPQLEGDPLLKDHEPQSLWLGGMFELRAQLVTLH